jgi:hypothetical protein
MKNYTNTERVAALNRHRESLSISKNGGFTCFTQHVEFKSIEEFCDIILHLEAMWAAYDIKDENFFDRNTFLFQKRKDIFFKENRILTNKETNECLKNDELQREYFDKVFSVSLENLKK